MKSLIGDPENSYAYKFAKELFKKWPEFSGTITAPYGGHRIYIMPSTTRDPELSGFPKTHGAQTIYFYDKDKEYVFLIG